MSQNLTDEIRKLVAWDKQCVVEEAKHEDSDGYFGFLTGAEWQHSKLIPIIEALLQDRERLRVALETVKIQNTCAEYLVECGDSIDGQTCMEAWDSLILETRSRLTESDAKLREILELEQN